MKTLNQIGLSKSRYVSPDIDITEIEAEEGYAVSPSQAQKNSADWTNNENYNEFNW